MKHLILASGSPRRHEILSTVGIAHTVYVSDADESSVKLDPAHPEDYVINIARLKNDAAAKSLAENRMAEGAVILSADTIVFSPDKKALGKPKTEYEAKEMLRSLSGLRHSVITGVVIRDADSGRVSEFAAVSDVFFRELDEIEIERYVTKEKPLDKAGAYGIQESAGAFVSKIDGEYSNIVGLPACRVVVELKKFGIFAD